MLLNAYIKEGELIKASQILQAEKLKDSKDVKLDQIEIALAKENFRLNYYSTRIAKILDGNKTILENGSSTKLHSKKS